MLLAGNQEVDHKGEMTGGGIRKGGGKRKGAAQPGSIWLGRAFLKGSGTGRVVGGGWWTGWRNR